LNRAAIAFCRRRHNLPNVDFVHGDAEKLPFPDQSFDAVINVEASHAYPRLPRFLAEVVRVLRPGGHFLYADFRDRKDFPDWEAALVDTPIRQVSKRVINAEVLRALEKNSQRSLDLIGRVLPAFLRPFGRWFAGVPGGWVYRDIQSGQIEYRLYCFTKN
jgi:ubiquinone/menaquinone biosynthesis C-methylase UbiE